MKSALSSGEIGKTCQLVGREWSEQGGRDMDGKPKVGE